MLRKFQDIELTTAYLVDKISQELKFKYVFKLNDRLITANTLRNVTSDGYSNIIKNWETDYYSLRNKPVLEKYPDVSNLFDLEFTNDLTIIQEKILDNIDSFVFSDEMDIENKCYLYDLNFLETNLKLDIYKLSEQDKLELVSIKIFTNEPAQT